MMNKSLAGIAVLTLVFGVAPNPAQNGLTSPSLPAELAPTLQRIHGDKIFQHVRTLASDKFEGRAPGSAGETLTVDYISNELKEAGLLPGNPNGRFVQQVPLIGYKTTPAISVSVNGRAVTLTFMNDFVHDLPRLVPQVDKKISGIVFAGYGISAPQFGWDDYKNTDVKNKLVLVLSGEPSRPDISDPKKADPAFFKGDIRTYYSTREFKYEQAQKRGAAGVLVITDPEKAQTFSLFQTFARMEGMALRSSSPGSLAIAGLITEKAAGRILAAADTTFTEAERKAGLSDSRPITLNATGRISIRSELRQITSHNVVAKVEGSDPVLKKEVVIYSAHWDHLGKDTSLTGDQIYNGANDNAAGVAQLIEVGRAFAALEKRPKRSVLLIATTAEEKGYLGARYYIRKPLYPISQTVAAINFDAGNMFGLTRDLGSTGYGNSTLDNALAGAASMQGRAFAKASIDSNGGMYFASDQIEFAKGGIPAVFPWSGFDYVGKSPDFGSKIWDAYSGERYHKVTDEVMPYWDMSGAVEDARWIMIAGFLVANGTTRPQFREGSEFPWIVKKRKGTIAVKKD